MSRRLLTALALLAAFYAARLGAAPRPGAAAPRFTATLDTIWSAGDTRYLMELPANPYGVSSELVFPLDTLVEGLRLRYEPGTPGRRPWSLEASVYTNLLNPLGSMQDYDWWMYPGYPKVPFSYTESAAGMRWYLATVEAQVELRSGGWGRINLAFGYRFQFIKQEITGYTGWDLDANRDGIIDSYSPQQDLTVHALDYRVIYNTLTSGLALTMFPAPPLSVTAEAGLALPFVSDRDDHLLRYKLSTAAGFGYGGYASLEARYTWVPAKSSLRPFLALSGSALGLKANTLQTQTWYGDDPASVGYDDTGTRLFGIDHRISIRQYRVAFAIGLQF
jgi:hypothetical protein